MDKWYVPYHGEFPAMAEINGHRVVVLARQPEQLTSILDRVGGDRVQVLEELFAGTEEEAFREIAVTTKAHVVVTPLELEAADVLKTLEKELPWIQ